jgi:hypothetical protein
VFAHSKCDNRIPLQSGSRATQIAYKRGYVHVGSDRSGYRSYVELFRETSRLILAAGNTKNQMQMWDNTLLRYYCNRNKNACNVEMYDITGNDATLSARLCF